jgi:hypothetical protein
MNHVFISYSRKDKVEVEHFVEMLNQIGIETWFDQRSLPVSLPWLDEIRDAIQEAVLFVICDSSNWRGSVACSTEMATATEFAKDVALITVRDLNDRGVEEVRNALGALTRSTFDLVELRVRARDWDRSGRRNQHLLGRHERKRLERSCGTDHQSENLIEFYLNACKRRTRRKTLLGSLGAVIAAVSGLFTWLIFEAPGYVGTNTQQVRERQNELMSITDVTPRNVYWGMQLAVDLPADTEAALVALGLMKASMYPTPDDAFELPGGEKTFPLQVIDDMVVVAFPDGTTYGRRVEETNIRTASKLDSFQPVAQETMTSLRVESVTNTGIIEIFSDDLLLRRFIAPGVVTDVEISPDGRSAAASVGDGIVIYDIESGRLRQHLRGAAGMVTDIAWTDDSSRIWSVAGEHAVSWSVSNARRLVNEPSTWFQAVVPAQTGGFWAADRGGLIRRFDLETGRELERIDVGRSVLLVGHDPTNSWMYLASTSDPNDVLVDLTSGTFAELPTLDCSHGRPQVIDEGTLVLIPCLDEGLRMIDTSTGQARFTIPIEGGARSVTVSADRSTAYVGGSAGVIWKVDLERLSVEQVHHLRCGTEITEIINSNDDHLLPVGKGTGRLGCSAIGLKSKSFDWNSWSDDVSDTIQARAGAFVTEPELFAVGYSNGTVVVRPTVNLLPSFSYHSGNGAIRSMFHHESTDELIVATQSGIIDVIPSISAITSNSDLLRLISDRLSRAFELGLADPLPNTLRP